MTSLDEHLRHAAAERNAVSIPLPAARTSRFRPAILIPFFASVLVIAGGLAVWNSRRGGDDPAHVVVASTPTTAVEPAPACRFGAPEPGCPAPASTTDASGVPSAPTIAPTTVGSTTASPTTTTAPATESASPTSVVGATGPVPTVDPNVWRVLPQSGLSKRISPLVVALGERVLVAGGSEPNENPDYSGVFSLADGAVLKADGSGWSRIAVAPEPVGASNAAVWTGTELLVLTTTGGFLSYNPAADRWSKLPEPAIALRANASAAWINGEMIVLAGSEPKANTKDGGASWTPRTDGAAYSPKANTWRLIPRPALPEQDSGLLRGWIGNRLWVVLGSSAIDVKARSYDPATNSWSAIADAPGGIVSLDHGVAMAADGSGTVFEYKPSTKAWTKIAELHHGDANGFGSVFRAGNRLIADTGSGGTNGRFLAVRQEAGTWRTIGSPVTTNEDRLLVTESGRLIDTNGMEAAELRYVDPTVGVRACVKADFTVSAVVGDGRGPNTSMVVLTNISASSCIVNGALPTGALLRINGQWVPPTKLDDTSFYSDSPQNGGGLILPGKSAAVDLWSSRLKYADNGKIPTCPWSTPDAVRFNLPSGETIESSIQLPEGCWHLGPLTGWTPAKE
jgi:hypothetical protein